MNSLKRKMNVKYQYIGILPRSVRIKENGFWGINDFEGNEILPSNYIEVFTLSANNRLIAARDAGSWNIYDYFGNKINSERYDYIYPYYGLFGLTKVKVGKNWGLLNKFGKVIVSIEHKKIEKFGKGILLHNFNSELEFIERSKLITLTKINKRNLSKKVKKPVHQKIINFSKIKTQAI